MYNGIGLATTRGSGTNGYVQQNKATLRPAFKHASSASVGSSASAFERRPNAELLLHEQKRSVEVQCLLLRDAREAAGDSDAAVDAQVAQLRATLLASLPKQQLDVNSRNSHVVRDWKDRRNEAAATALGIRNHVEGEAFDRDLQERRKQERIQERNRLEEEQRERIKQKERDAKKGAASLTHSLTLIHSLTHAIHFSEKEGRRRG
ncbi:hypothetical protein BDR26DRAFT_656838 [Obelidium mucronatum]|nr:hypothetical protein BDR26DRAFT_656838 [Obelidium mucronatum]